MKDGSYVAIRKKKYSPENIIAIAVRRTSTDMARQVEISFVNNLVLNT